MANQIVDAVRTQIEKGKLLVQNNWKKVALMGVAGILVAACSGEIQEPKQVDAMPAPGTPTVDTTSPQPVGIDLESPSARQTDEAQIGTKDIRTDITAAGFDLICTNSQGLTSQGRWCTPDQREGDTDNVNARKWYFTWLVNAHTDKAGQVTYQLVGLNDPSHYTNKGGYQDTVITYYTGEVDNDGQPVTSRFTISGSAQSYGTYGQNTLPFPVDEDLTYVEKMIVTFRDVDADGFQPITYTAKRPSLKE